jgi:hypothetical protein
MQMSLVDRLKNFEGGYIADLEQGAFLGLFIGRMVKVVAEGTIVELKLVEADLFRMNGMLVDRNRSFGISWNLKFTAPSVSVETSQRLAFYVPNVGVNLILYPESHGRPEFAEVFRHMTQTRYI